VSRAQGWRFRLEPFTQPRVSTLGTLKLNEFALKLKVREADRVKLAPIVAQNLERASEMSYN